MKSLHKLILILSIFTATIITGVFVLPRDNPNEEEEPPVVFESNVTLRESYNIFQELPEAHIPRGEGRERYVLALRQYRADQITFDDLLELLQDIIKYDGLIQLAMEPGMFSVYDSGPMSRFHIVTQYAKDRDDALVLTVDLGSGPPYASNPVFRGPVHFIEIFEEFETVVITLLDGSEYSLYWGEIGVY